MSFFYDLNKKLNGIRADDKQITESVEKAVAKTETQKTLEQALGQDLKSLMEDASGGMAQSNTLEAKTKSYSAKDAAAGKDIGKPGKNFAKIAKSSGGGEKGKRIAGAVLAKLRAAKESVEEASEEMAQDDVPAHIHQLANQWWNAAGNQPQVASKLRSLGYLIKQTDSDEDDAVELKTRNGKTFYISADTFDPEEFAEAGAGGIHGRMPDPMTQKDQQKKMNPPRSLEEKDESEEDIMDYLNRKLAPYEKQQQAKEDAVATPYNAGTGRPDAHNGMEFEGNAFTGKLASTPKGGEFELDGEEYKDTSSLEETVSRKHFQQVADLLCNIPDLEKRKELALHHASIFKQQNPRFDIRRFAQACDVDLEECAMWEELKGGQVKLDKNHDGKLDATDFAMLRGDAEVDEGFADMDRWLAQREKEKGTGKFDSRKVSTGTVYTRKPETYGDEESDSDQPAVKRGRGRPTKAKAPERVTAKAYKHKGGRVQEEGDEMVDEKAEAGKRHFFDKLAPAAKKVAKVVGAVTKGNEDKTEEKSDKKSKKTEDSKPDYVDLDKDGDKKEPMKKAAKDKKEEKVDETTTSGSVATTDSPRASKGGAQVGKGIYDSWNREFEQLLAESVNVSQESAKMEDGNEEESITINVTGDDVARFKEVLKSMGLGHQGGDAMAEPAHHDSCHTCGGTPCQCDEVGAEVVGLPGEMEIEIEEADAPVSQNSPDYPTNQEESDDALQYSGGLDGPKSTGQTTIPVVASQEDRLHTMEESFDSFLNLYKTFKTK